MYFFTRVIGVWLMIAKECLTAGGALLLEERRLMKVAVKFTTTAATFVVRGEFFITLNTSVVFLVILMTCTDVKVALSTVEEIFVGV